MKVASPATLAIMASGQSLKLEFWQITLASPYTGGAGETYFFTAGGEQAYNIGGNLYQNGLIFARQEIHQKCGTEVGSLDITVAPQFDYPGGPPLIAGGQFLAQLSAGVFDNAVWTMSKGFFLPSGSDAVTANGYTYTPPPLGSQLDTSPGIVPWWSGVTSKVEAGRQSVDITLDEATAILANQQMPRNMIQAGCVHRLFDPGCTLSQAQNTYAGHVTVVSPPNVISTNMSATTFANGYFNQGIITFTSGVLMGASFTVQYSVASGGNVVLGAIAPFPSMPSVNDTYSVTPGCDKTFPTCSSSKFVLPSGVKGSNALHYRGCPFVPQPETLYDGGTGSETLATIGTQGKPGLGSVFTGNVL